MSSPDRDKPIKNNVEPLGLLPESLKTDIKRESTGTLKCSVGTASVAESASTQDSGKTEGEVKGRRNRKDLKVSLSNARLATNSQDNLYVTKALPPTVSTLGALRSLLLNRSRLHQIAGRFARSGVLRQPESQSECDVSLSVGSCEFSKKKTQSSPQIRVEPVHVAPVERVIKPVRSACVEKVVNQKPKRGRPKMPQSVRDNLMKARMEAAAANLEQKKLSRQVSTRSRWFE